MDSINNPVGDNPKDPYEGYRSEAIERDRAAKEEFARRKEALEESSSFLVGYLTLVYRKLLDLFLAKTERGVSVSVERETKEHLSLFKNCLEMLQTQDLSQDLTFLNRLSELWQLVLEDSLRFRKTSSFSVAFRRFVRTLQNYPEQEEHTFGYYLSEYAGQTWLPFPYMELMQKIHSEENLLGEWCKVIEELIGLLNPG